MEESLGKTDVPDHCLSIVLGNVTKKSEIKLELIYSISNRAQSREECRSRKCNSVFFCSLGMCFISPFSLHPTILTIARHKTLQTSKAIPSETKYCPIWLKTKFALTLGFTQSLIPILPDILICFDVSRTFSFISGLKHLQVYFRVTCLFQTITCQVFRVPCFA